MSLIEVVDTIDSVAQLADRMLNLPASPPTLYLDLEGVKLSRHGSISLLTIYILPNRTVYLVDVRRLGAAAFSTEGEGKQSLQDILESEIIPKVFFDVRNDADALHWHFQVRLGGVKDLQLMELATRRGSKRHLNGLTKCISIDAGLGRAQVSKWKKCKSLGIAMFAPEKGGDYEVFNLRPLKEAIIDYCAQDVTLLPKLWNTYNAKLHPVWRAKVEKAVRENIAKSCSAEYVPHGAHKSLGPW